MISIIIPFYNSEDYLEDCLQSITSQTYKDFEVILVNDGSTDSSRAICANYCLKHHNFTLIDKENGGQMSAWIMGLQHVKGEFVGFVDSDDLIEPTFLEELCSAQKKYDADCVMCSRAVFKNNSKLPPVIHHLDIQGYFADDEKDYIRSRFLPSFEGNLSQARWDKLFRTDIIKKCAEKYCKKPVRTFEDRFVVIPYVFYSSSFVFVDKPLYKCRIVQNSSSKKFRSELCDIADQLYSNHIQLINDLGIYEKYVDQIEMEKIDVLRAIFERNICSKVPFKTHYCEAKKILSKENRKIVKKHKKECAGKFGRYFLMCCRFNSPLLLVYGGKLFNLVN